MDETLSLNEDLICDHNQEVTVQETLVLIDHISDGPLSAFFLDESTIRVNLPGLHYTNCSSVDSYTLTPVSHGVEVGVLSVAINLSYSSEGTTCDVVSTNQANLYGATYGLALGDFLHVAGSIAQVVGASNTGTHWEVLIDRPLSGSDSWVASKGVTQVDLKLSKPTKGTTYSLKLSGLYYRSPKEPFVCNPLLLEADNVFGPKLTEVNVLADGTLLVRFSSPMNQDSTNLTRPEVYTILGDTAVQVVRVRSLDSQTVVLETLGLRYGSYVLTANAVTLVDQSLNTLDSTFSALPFTGVDPEKNRSIFTDRGPITKREDVLQSGLSVEMSGPNELTISDGSFDSTHVGLMLRLSGVDLSGSYRVISAPEPKVLKLAASFSSFDGSSTSWELVDPRSGMLADSPSDVTVLINGVGVTPERVIGLRGQIVLPIIPEPTDTVTVDYNWISNPTVEFRSLNSPEFRLNSWNRDSHDTGQSRRYRYNLVTVRPGDYQALDTRVLSPSPQQRGLKYRGFEREYSNLRNDSSRLRLNTPQHKISYPKRNRILTEVSVFYESDTLPELSTPVWVKSGSGSATTSIGVLTTQNTLGSPLIWVQDLDLTFDNVFALAWRGGVPAVAAKDGVWSGLVVGYSDEYKSYLLGFLEDSLGTKYLGFLLGGSQDRLEDLDSWRGATDSNLIEFDWSVLHSYRLFKTATGVVSLYLDGGVVPSLEITDDRAPNLNELGSPLSQVQGVVFGHASQIAVATANWDFVRYSVKPLRSEETALATFVSYEGDSLPERDTAPWTPIGYQGTATLVSDSRLLLETTSATDQEVGLISGDFKSYSKLEPLLTTASEVAVDVGIQVLSSTGGADPYAVTFGIVDADRLLQVSLVSSEPSPVLSYGGRLLPESFGDYAWSSVGSQPARMVGRTLRIEDSSDTDGKVYFCEDSEAPLSSNRVLHSSFDYAFESRVDVISYITDLDGFAGVYFQVYDGLRSVGLMFTEVLGVKYLEFQSDGSSLTVPVSFVYDWSDGSHSYLLRKSASGDLVSLFVDGSFVGSTAYSSFTIPVPSNEGQLTFGSATPISTGSVSVVDWYSCNAWRYTESPRFVGIWKGTETSSLLDFHIASRVEGNASIQANTLEDLHADFIAAGVTSGQLLAIDSGFNRGVYAISNVVSSTVLTVASTWTKSPSEVHYSVLQETDWSNPIRLRLSKGDTGQVTLTDLASGTALVSLDYSSPAIPRAEGSIFETVTAGLPAVCFGSYSGPALSRSLWDYVRYGITSSAFDGYIVPPHQVLNQWNIMESPERLTTQVAHVLTSFKSSSTGITPNTYPDFLDNTAVEAHTLLNEGTPLMPLTQSTNYREPVSSRIYSSSLNNPKALLNSSTFRLNDPTFAYVLEIPPGVLYSSLQVIESTEGSQGRIAPFYDNYAPRLGAINYTTNTCLGYSGSILPENDLSSGTPWRRNSTDPTQVQASTDGTSLHYGTLGPTQTAYLNDTPLPDAPSLQTTATFRLRLEQDGSAGLGDSQVRFGLSAPGMTVGIGFVTDALGERSVQVFDLKSNVVLGYATFDYLDGQYHTYRITRDPCAKLVQVTVDT